MSHFDQRALLCSCRETLSSLAEGLLRDRQDRLGRGGPPSEEELAALLAAGLTLEYRLLLLLFAEARQLGPAAAEADRASRLTVVAREIAAAAGSDPRLAARRTTAAYSRTGNGLWDRLAGWLAPAGGASLFSPALCSSCENGTASAASPGSAFLVEHRVADRFLAAAIDGLARQRDPASGALVAVDYRSADVRRLGQVHEGLAQCKLAWRPAKAKGAGARRTDAKGTVPFSLHENRDSPPRKSGQSPG